jgi:Dolichyl-phosphate-mannose-protein mannosyltransferase
VLGLAAIGGYVILAVARLGYPFTLELLESNSLVEVHRVLAGQPLYPPPSASYVPDGYPPLYFGVCAVMASFLGQSYLPLRLVSLVSSLACFAITARLVRRETGSRAAGAAAAGLVAATYFACGTWFDVARVDSLFLALSVAGLYAARWMRRPRGAVMAGLLLAAAFLTKQTGLAEGVAVLAALACGPRRRLATTAALAYAIIAGGSTLALGVASHGWYVYYVFEQMSEHALSAAAAGQFWTSYLLPTLGIGIAAIAVGARRVPLVLLAGCAALVAESYVALVHTGGGVNDMLPAYLVVALLAGLALVGRRDLPAGGSTSRGAASSLAWIARPRPGAGRCASWMPGLLVVTQLAVLAAGFRPAHALPAEADWAAGARLTAGLRALGGTIAIPADPALALRAGLPEVEDQLAAVDVLRASDQAAKADFTRSVAREVAAAGFTAIITEVSGDLRGFPADLPRYYHRCPQTPLAGIQPAPFRRGPGLQPVSIWLPVGHGSCAAVARALGAPPPATPTQSSSGDPR